MPFAQAGLDLISFVSVTSKMIHTTAIISYNIMSSADLHRDFMALDDQGKPSKRWYFLNCKKSSPREFVGLSAKTSRKTPALHHLSRGLYLDAITGLEAFHSPVLR